MKEQEILDKIQYYVKFGNYTKVLEYQKKLNEEEIKENRFKFSVKSFKATPVILMLCFFSFVLLLTSIVLTKYISDYFVIKDKELNFFISISCFFVLYYISGLLVYNYVVKDMIKNFTDDSQED